MPEAYSPIVRTFCQFRSSLTNILGVARHDVRPATPLDELLPIEKRREAWMQLQRQGLRLPDLEFLRAGTPAQFLDRFEAGRVVCSPLTELVRPALCPSAHVHRVLGASQSGGELPIGLSTVGELVIYATRFREHKNSGYRWTRNEISMKVRMIVAESVGMPLEAIQPETKLLELC